MQILSQKLKILKSELKIWNKTIFGDIHNQVATSIAKLDDIQKIINIHGCTDSLMKQVKLAKVEESGILKVTKTVVLILKVSNVDNISQYMPIAMANFKFKVISKILADRLTRILPKIISKEQRGFITGRQIEDCICLTS